MALAAGRDAVLRRAGWDVEADGLQGGPRVSVVLGQDAHVTIFPERTRYVVRRLQNDGTAWFGGGPGVGAGVMRVSLITWWTREHEVDRSVDTIRRCLARSCPGVESTCRAGTSSRTPYRGRRLGGDRQGKLRRLVAGQVESERGVEVAEALLAHAARQQRRAAILLFVPAADRPDVGRVRGEGDGEGGLVDLRVVRDDDDVIRIGEARPRVDDNRVEAREGGEPAAPGRAALIRHPPDREWQSSGLRQRPRA